LRKLIRENSRKTIIKYGFTCLHKNGEDIPQCVLCLETLANSCLKLIQLKQHLNNIHTEQVSKSIKYSDSKKEGCLKRVRLHAGGAFHQTNFSIIEASYVVALRIAKAKLSHTIVETLVKPHLLDCTKIVLEDSVCNNLKQVSLSNDRIKVSATNSPI